MVAFIAAADESSDGTHEGEFIYGGLVAPESDWRDWFAPAWEERVLNMSPPIPYLHMVEMRSRKWRAQNHLTEIDAERRVDEAFRVIKSMGSLFLVTSHVHASDFRKIFSKITIKSPRKKAVPPKPDFIGLFAFVYVVLRHVNEMYPEAEKVDFIVERNGKITSHIKEFYSTLGEFFESTSDAPVHDLLGDLISGGKEDVPLQVADVVCRHSRRLEADVLSPVDARRYGTLAQKKGFRHEWTKESLVQFASQVRGLSPKLDSNGK